MKRSTLLLICLLVFVALVGGAAAWMYFSPGGALAPVTAEDAVQELLDTTDTAEWRAKYVSLCAPETSVFENAETVAGDLFDAAVQGQNTLQLQLQMRQAELDALQQMEGESDAAFKARQLAAQQAYVDAKRAVNDYEIQIEQAKLEALAAVTNGLSGLLEELGEDNKAFAVLSKTLALAEIAINTGKAIAAGTAQAQSVPFPGNLIAIATTVATIMANITSAIKTVKSAKFSTGGYVSGPGTSTSDSIPAMLSDGESVNAALPTSMFAPIYSALNQLGGGAPIVAAQSSNQIAGEDMLARAFAKGVSQLDMRVGVDEITRVSDRVKVVESLGDL